MWKLNRKVLLCFILLLAFSNCNRNNDNNNKHVSKDSLITESSTLKDSLIIENRNLSNSEMLPLYGEWKMYKYIPTDMGKDRLDTICIVSITDSTFVKKRENKILFQGTIRFNMKFSNDNFTRFDFPNYSEKYIRYNTKKDYFALFEKGEDGVIEYYKRK